MPIRNEYTKNDETLLAMYIAKYNPQQQGRLGNLLYQRLCENATKDWPFSRRHTWQSWREHYKQNQSRMDEKIRKYIPRYHRELPPSPSRAHARPPPSASQASGRVPFTREDDGHLAKYLALNAGSGTGSLLGQKFWQTLVEQEEEMPWVKNHSWHSWRERYKKNQAYFDWAARRYLSDGEFDEPEPPRPKTVEDFCVRKPAAKVHSAAGPSRTQGGAGAKVGDARANSARHNAVPETRKRPRASSVDTGERPAKKTRVAGDRNVEDREAERPPSRSQTAVAGAGGEGASDADADNASEPPTAAWETAREASVEEEAAEPDESDEESQEEEALGPPGSDDYHGEIFDSPQAEPVNGDDIPAGDGSANSDDSDQELDELLGDTPSLEDAQRDPDNGMDVDCLIDSDKTVSREEPPADVPEQQDASDHNVPPQPDMIDEEPPPTANAVPVVAHDAAACTEQHDPPARKHNTRIRDAEAPLATPELSPTREAAARHRQQGPVPRRHAKRIKKPVDDDFFGTPPPTTVQGDAGVDEQEPSSPTTVIEARHHRSDTHTSVKSKALHPQSDEKAHNETSGSQGRPHIKPQPEQPRRSAVNFEGEDIAIDEEDSHAGSDHEEHASELLQWPPLRRKNSAKAKATAPGHPTPTPAVRHKGKERERTVTTERIVSIRTVRTVEHGGGRPTEAPRYHHGMHAAPLEHKQEQQAGGREHSPQRSQNVDASPVADTREDEEDGGGDSWSTLPQHHPFSQAPHPFSQQVQPSPVRTSTRLGAPLSKADLSRFQRLLHPQRDEQRQNKDAPLSRSDRAVLDNILRKRIKGVFPGPNNRTSLPGGTSGLTSSAGTSLHPLARPHLERGEATQTLFSRAQTSPLASKGDMPPEIAEQQGRIMPRQPSGLQEHRVDKGKGHADAPDAGTHPRRYTTGEITPRDVFDHPEQRSEVPELKHPSRRSLPSTFALRDDNVLANRTALTLAVRPPVFLLGGSPSTPSAAYLSRSVSPGKSMDTSVDSLPPRELEIVKQLGLNTAILIMAQNHGFSEDTVREVYARTGSLELADNVLREMREGANERASEVLSHMSDEPEGVSDQSDGSSDEFDDVPDKVVDEGHTGEEAEVERELTQQPDWLPDTIGFDFADDGPIAESSRLDASHIPSRDSGSGSGSRRRQRLRIQPVPPEQDSIEYSPPKHTRAAAYVKRAQHSIERPSRESAMAAMDKNDIPSPPSIKVEESGGIDFGRLTRMDQEDWRKLEETHGKGAAKVLAGKSLAKFLRR